MSFSRVLWNFFIKALIRWPRLAAFLGTFPLPDDLPRDVSPQGAADAEIRVPPRLPGDMPERIDLFGRGMPHGDTSIRPGANGPMVVHRMPC